MDAGAARRRGRDPARHLRRRLGHDRRPRQPGQAAPLAVRAGPPRRPATAPHHGAGLRRTAAADQADPADTDDRPPTPAWQAVAEEELPDIRSDLEPAELLSLIRGILAELPPREREVIELSLRHNLHDDDLAEALEMSASRAHALTERARGRLEKALGALLVARIGLQACPELGTLLGDWDGRLTEETRDLIARHVEQCDTCAGRRQGTLRQAALSGLQPLVPLPPGLREQVLKLCSSATPDVVAYRQHATRRAESVWRARVSQVITLMKWGSIRANPGRALAVVVVVIWVVAAVSSPCSPSAARAPPGPWPRGRA